MKKQRQGEPLSPAWRGRPLLILVILAFLAACGGSDGPAAPPGDPPTQPPADPPAQPSAQLVAVQGEDQSAPAGTTLPYIPLVGVVNSSGSPISGVAVEFEVVSGGGTIIPVISVTGANGIAAANWRLGGSPGTNTLRITAEGVPEPLEIQATGRAVSTPFQIELDLEDPDALTSAQMASLEAAAIKVRSVVSQALPTVQANIPEIECAGLSVPALNRTLSNPIIRVGVRRFGHDPGFEEVSPDFTAIATTCIFLFLEGENDFRPTLVGAIVVNSDRAGNSQAVGNLEAILVHELMHALGFGTIWVADASLGWTDLVQGRGGADPRFTGPAAISAYGAVDGNPEGAVPVPLENNVPGSNDAHWRSSVVAPEVMNPGVDIGFTPLSRVTAATLADVGYAVNLSQADPFEIAEAQGALRGYQDEAAPGSAAEARWALSEVLGAAAAHVCAAEHLPSRQALAIDLQTGERRWTELR